MSRLIDGMALGTLFLLSFAGGLASPHNLQWAILTARGIRERISGLEIELISLFAIAFAIASIARMVWALINRAALAV